MTTKYGFKTQEWDKAKEELGQALVARARLRGVIPYSDLVNMVHTIRLEPHSHALAAMLGEVAAEEDAAGWGMLTVTVVHRGGDMQPGPSFFDLAKQLGRSTSDILKCWIDELENCHE